MTSATVSEAIRRTAEALNPQLGAVPGRPGPKPAARPTAAPLTEGWLARGGAMWHYMRAGRSLCGGEKQGPHHLRPFLPGGARPCRVCEEAARSAPAAPAPAPESAPASLAWVQRRHNKQTFWQVVAGPVPAADAETLLEEVRQGAMPIYKFRVIVGETESNALHVGEIRTGVLAARRRAQPQEEPVQTTPQPAPAPTPPPAPPAEPLHRVEVLRPDSSVWETFRSGLNYHDAATVRSDQVGTHDRSFKFRIVDDSGRLHGRELPGRAGQVPPVTTSLAARLASLIEDETSSRTTDLLVELAAVKAERDTLKAKLAAVQAALGGTL